MAMQVPVRLGPAEETLIAQLNAKGASAEAERLSASGLPTRRVESYHYTDLKTLLRAVPELAAEGGEASGARLAVDGAKRIEIRNGKVALPGDLPGAIKADTTPGGVLTTRDDVLVRLNGALVGDSLSLDLHGEIADIIQIDRLIDGAAAHVASGAKIFLGEAGKAVVVETFSGSDAAHVGNAASYVAVGKNAELTHVMVNLMPGEATHFATAEYHLAEGAKLRTLVINAGAKLSRVQLFPRYGGANAHGDITALNLVGDGQHVDVTMDAHHAVPHTTSQPLFKSVARGRSTAVVQGRLVVARDAQKTDAKMMAQGLMLSDEANILAKPELEIYADDVVCGHGATCGRLDEDSLFYLMSRGIPQTEAETMLTRAFLAEVIDPITDEALKAALDGVIENWLGQGA